MTYTQICVDVIIAVMAVAKLAPILLIGLQFLGRHLLDTQRINAWNADGHDRPAVEPTPGTTNFVK